MGPRSSVSPVRALNSIGTLCTSHHQHWARRQTNNLLSTAPQQHSTDTSPAVGSHHYQAGIPLPGLRSYCFSQMSSELINQQSVRLYACRLNNGQSISQDFPACLSHCTDNGARLARIRA